MEKTVVYYLDQVGRNPVWKFIQGLVPSDRNKCFEYIAYLEEFGEKVERPIGAYLGNKIYELRPKQTRILYFFVFKKYIVLVHAFRKKTSRVPEFEIKTAEKRRDDFMKRYLAGEIELE